MTQGILNNGGRIRCDVCRAWITKARPNQVRCTGQGLTECQRTAERRAIKKRGRYIKSPDRNTLSNKQRRPCLKCGRKFNSKDRFNRLCDPCKEINEGKVYNVHRERRANTVDRGMV